MERPCITNNALPQLTKTNYKIAYLVGHFLFAAPMMIISKCILFIDLFHLTHISMDLLLEQIKDVAICPKGAKSRMIHAVFNDL